MQIFELHKYLYKGECEMEKEYIHEEMLELEDLELDEEDLLIRAGKTLG
ncbi:hypothetical protein SZ39_2733 [Bacillus mycoides]|nr:hypothetical protein SZ39_2733 [Bacillus mycoides]